MSLSPRAIALQGLGFAPLLVAAQGLSPLAAPSALVVGGGGTSFQAMADWQDPLQETLQREDDEILTLIMSAVTCGAVA